MDRSKQVMRWLSGRRCLLPLGGALALAILAGGCAGWSKNKCLSGAASEYDISKLGRRFDAPAPDYDYDHVAIRYLGAGGVYIEWQGGAVMVSPSFTAYPGGMANPKVEPDTMAIRTALQGIYPEKIQAVLVGSSRFDRLADIPELAKRLPNADVYVNQTGKHLMAPYEQILDARKSTGTKKPRIREINGKDHPRIDSTWGPVRGVNGEAIRMRVRAIPFKREDPFVLEEDAESEWEGVYHASDFFEGQPHAFAIELLEEDLKTIAFRILVVESGSNLKLGDLSGVTGDENPDELAGKGDELGEEPTEEGEDDYSWSVEDIDAEMEAEAAAAEEAPEGVEPKLPEGRTKGIDEFDVVVISVRSHLYYETDPTLLYRSAKAGHVILIDYEDATKMGARRLHFAHEVKGKDAAGLVCTTERAIGKAPWVRIYPRKGGMDGLRSKTLTMPLPGEWMIFLTEKRAAAEAAAEAKAKAEAEAKATAEAEAKQKAAAEKKAADEAAKAEADKEKKKEEEKRKAEEKAARDRPLGGKKPPPPPGKDEEDVVIIDDE